MHSISTTASHVGYRISEPPGQAPALDNQATEQSFDQPVHFSHSLGRALIALSVAPIPVVAPLLRLVVRPVAGTLQRNTNRQLINRLNTLREASDWETKTAALEYRANVLHSRSCSQFARFSLQPSPYHKLASVFNYLAVPALALAVTPYIPALTTLPVLSGIAIPGLLPTVAVTLVGVGCVWGLEAFNTWRDWIQAFETMNQSVDFFAREEYIHTENRVNKLLDENRTLRSDTLALTLENAHQKQQLAARRPGHKSKGSDHQEPEFDPDCSDPKTIYGLLTEEICRLRRVNADNELCLQKIQNLTSKQGAWSNLHGDMAKALTDLNQLNGQIWNIAQQDHGQDDQVG